MYIFIYVWVCMCMYVRMLLYSGVNWGEGIKGKVKNKIYRSVADAVFVCVLNSGRPRNFFFFLAFI